MDKAVAFSQLTIKAVDEERRQISGWATTPEPDRVGDVVDPMGAEFHDDTPLLWMHRHDMPIGSVKFGKATPKGIPFTATIAKVASPSQLAARFDEAWESVKARVVKFVSIGFRPLEYSVIEETGGLRFTRSEIYELSLVSVPANGAATIDSFKSLDHAARVAASGEGPKDTDSGATEKPATSRSKVKIQTGVKDMKKTISEQLADFRKTLEIKNEELVELADKSGEAGETLDEADKEKFDTTVEEVEEIKKHIARLEIAEKASLATAKPVTQKSGEGEQAAKETRSAAIVKSVKNEEQGLGFTKFALAMYAGKGDLFAAKSFAEIKFGNDTRLQNYMKAAVAAGTTTSATWAGNLVRTDNLSSEFLEYLRPRTIIGQFGVGGVPSLRRIPFNVRIPGKTGTGTAAWVGEGYAKPVTSSTYAATEHKWAKIAAISVITEELDRFSDPSIQALVRDDLAEAVIERADVDFINPDKAAGTGASLSPASITNGVTPIVATGDPTCDIPALWATADSTNLPASSAVYITDSRTARMLSMYENPISGARQYPNVTMTGGSIDGVPVIISNYVPADSAGSLFILAFASEIYLSDDGQVNIDVSREASILMDSDASASMNSGTPTAAALVSMFQTNSLAIRAERYINWSKRRPQAVAYLEGVDWSNCS